MPPLSPIDQFAADNVAPPTPAPPEDAAPLDPLQPYEPSLVIPKGEAPDRPSEPAPDELRAQVAQWWARTNDTPEFSRRVRQLDRDTATIFGMPNGEQSVDEWLLQENNAAVTNHHIYRNAVTSMALIMPENPEIEIEPEPQFPKYDPIAGAPLDDTDGIDWRVTAFADLLDRLQRKLCAESRVMQNIRGGFQDAHHYEMAVFKVTWQADYRSETMQEDRLPDIQAKIAEAEAMLERFERNEFFETDAEYRTMSDLFASIEAMTELPVWRGVMVKSIPSRMFRIDPTVKRSEDVGQAEWMRQDYLMSRAEVLRRYKTVSPEDLSRASVYTASGEKQANDTRESQEVYAIKPDGAAILPGNNSVRSINDWDLLLVAEIWSEPTGTVYVLVEGLDYYARTYTPERTARSFYPFKIFVLNRTPGNVRLAGFSDTELQAKEQERINRIDTQEDEAARNSRNRGIYDKDVIEDNVTVKINQLDADQYIGVSFGGNDVSKAFVPIMGTPFNGEAFGARRATATANLRAMSGVPEQMLGGQGDPKFAKQIDAVQSGAATLNKYRRTLGAELLTELWQDLLELIVLNMEVEDVVALQGPNAAEIWLAAPKDRMTVYRNLRVRVRPSLEGKPGKQESLNGIKLLIDSSVQLNQPIPFEQVAPLIAKVLELPVDIDRMLKSNPNQLAMQLAKALTENPQGIAPEALQALMQVAMPIVQQEIAAQAQAMAAEGAGGPSGAAGGDGGAPPIPGPGAMPTPGKTPPGADPSPTATAGAGADLSPATPGM